jgi:hypothetical protein
MRGETLYVGFDEAGHASRDSSRGEVVVAFYSLDPNDARPLIFSRDRKSRDAQTHLILAQNNHFFTKIPTATANESESNLMLVAPLLLDKCIEEAQSKGIEIGQFGIYFDGAAPNFCNSVFYEDMAINFSSLPCTAIQHFKKNNKRRSNAHAFVKCPRVVYCADQRAHALYTVFRELEEYGRLVSLPEGYIEKRTSELETLAKRIHGCENSGCKRERLVYRRPY